MDVGVASLIPCCQLSLAPRASGLPRALPASPADRLPSSPAEWPEQAVSPPQASVSSPHSCEDKRSPSGKHLPGPQVYRRCSMNVDVLLPFSLRSRGGGCAGFVPEAQPVALKARTCLVPLSGPPLGRRVRGHGHSARALPALSEQSDGQPAIAGPRWPQQAASLRLPAGYAFSSWPRSETPWFR